MRLTSLRLATQDCSPPGRVYSRAMGKASKFATVSFAMLLLGSACTEKSEPSQDFGDDYMTRYALWLSSCRQDMEARYGQAAAGSDRMQAYIAACDETWRANNPAPNP